MAADRAAIRISRLTRLPHTTIHMFGRLKIMRELLDAIRTTIPDARLSTGGQIRVRRRREQSRLPGRAGGPSTLSFKVTIPRAMPKRPRNRRLYAETALAGVRTSVRSLRQTAP